MDIHAHLITDGYRRAWAEGGHGDPDGILALPDWSVAQALSFMDEDGVDAALLSVSSPGIFFGDRRAAVSLARIVNDESAAVVAAHPARFGFAASLPLPDVNAAIAEARRCLTELRADAVSLLTNYGGLYLGDPQLRPLLEMLDEHRAVVLVHPTSPPCWEQVSFNRPRPLLEFLLDTTRAVVNLILAGDVAGYRRIRWVIPHAGAALPVLADRIHLLGGYFARGDEPDVDVLDDLGSMFFDVAGAALPRALPALRDLVGTDRLLYGSDYPFTPGPAASMMLGALRATAPDLLGAEADHLFAHNAAALFPRLGGA
ncbi:amidohydrolase family protein [Micromonospora sp. WMMD1155]|uniref:amidohydrolase family protein n=1 Tax=Micromonospora sp. WMMD1155 TaxID=3016094 RepID=UPI00249A787D|nr:amidohydrolase family protein [Micromonospora sp. WMMD1155]WFE54945.1 amidohydrolase family protein [Micromonospora sp. WMMD1155]